MLILTMHDSEQTVREVVSTGARGYVLKSDAGRSLVAAVESLLQHRPFLTQRASEIVTAEPGDKVPGRQLRALGQGIRATWPQGEPRGQ